MKSISRSRFLLTLLVAGSVSIPMVRSLAGDKCCKKRQTSLTPAPGAAALAGGAGTQTTPATPPQRNAEAERAAAQRGTLEERSRYEALKRTALKQQALDEEVARKASLTSPPEKRDLRLELESANRRLTLQGQDIDPRLKLPPELPLPRQPRIGQSGSLQNTSLRLDDTGGTVQDLARTTSTPPRGTDK